MGTPVNTLLLLMSVFAQTPGNDDNVQARLELTLTSARPEYVLGQPVELKASLKNKGQTPIVELRADQPAHQEAVDVFLSKDNVHFWQYAMGIYASGKTERPKETLAPGGEWTFELWVLYAYKSPSRLAFDSPGTYFIKVAYPLISRSYHGRVLVESNALAVRIREPEGNDAKLWVTIQEPGFLYFLQSGHSQEDNLDVPRLALKLLKGWPTSSYTPGLQRALGEFWEHRLGSSMRKIPLEEQVFLYEVRDVLNKPK